MAPSVFSQVPQAPADAILGISAAYKADKDPNALNLGVGAYRTEEGKPLVLECVREAERRILADPTVDKEYLTQVGLPEFFSEAAKLAFGPEARGLAEGRVVSSQGLSGTGSLRLGGEFLAKFYPASKTIYLPQPTWAAHHNVFRAAGLSVETYRYYDAATRGLDRAGLLADLEAAPRGSIVLLHACAHNPTGVDPSRGDWGAVLEVVRARGLLPFFDSAYQGFASGDLDADAYAVRLFEAAGVELLLAQSFAKNMGLYGERVGALHLVLSDRAAVEPALSQIKAAARALYSSPPKHGALVAAAVLRDPELSALWRRELRGMADRIIEQRRLLAAELSRLGTPGSWSHITSQIGMFSYTGLTRRQVSECLTERHHIYLTLDGRISMAGLSAKTVPILAQAIDDAVRNFSGDKASL